RAYLRGGAGLSVEPDRQLDDPHRPDLRSDRAAVPAGHPWHLRHPHEARMTASNLQRATQPADNSRSPAIAPKSSLLRLEHVSRHFGTVKAVDGVSLDMSVGELRAVIGPNGAGKTTFFNLISGLLPPTRGEVWFEGENITRQSVVRRVARGIVR